MMNENFAFPPGLKKEALFYKGKHSPEENLRQAEKHRLAGNWKEALPYAMAEYWQTQGPIGAMTAAQCFLQIAMEGLPSKELSPENRQYADQAIAIFSAIIDAGLPQAPVLVFRGVAYVFVAMHSRDLSKLLAAKEDFELAYSKSGIPHHKNYIQTVQNLIDQWGVSDQRCPHCGWSYAFDGNRCLHCENALPAPTPEKIPSSASESVLGCGCLLVLAGSIGLGAAWFFAPDPAMPQPDEVIPAAAPRARQRPMAQPVAANEAAPAREGRAVVEEPVAVFPVAVPEKNQIRPNPGKAIPAPPRPPVARTPLPEGHSEWVGECESTGNANPISMRVTLERRGNKLTGTTSFPSLKTILSFDGIVNRGIATVRTAKKRNFGDRPNRHPLRIPHPMTLIGEITDKEWVGTWSAQSSGQEIRSAFRLSRSQPENQQE